MVYLLCKHWQTRFLSCYSRFIVDSANSSFPIKTYSAVFESFYFGSNVFLSRIRLNLHSAKTCEETRQMCAVSSEMLFEDWACFVIMCFYRILFVLQVVNLILSDIVGDPLDCIASGPTVRDTSSPRDALDIVNKYLTPYQVQRD